MLTNELLEIKYLVQKNRSRQSHYDVKRQAEQTHQIVQELQKKGLKIKYGIPGQSSPQDNQRS